MKFLRFLLVILMLTFVMCGVVRAGEDEGGGEGGGGGGKDPRLPPEPIITMPPGDTTPWVSDCWQGEYCWKCNFDENNPDPNQDVGSTEQPCFVDGNETQEAISDLEADGWFCPTAHYDTKWYEDYSNLGHNSADINDLVDRLKQAMEDAKADGDDAFLITVSKAWIEIQKWLFECMGRTYVCNENEGAAAEKCTLIDCDTYGQCEWDEKINHCLEGEENFQTSRVKCIDCNTSEYLPDSARCIYTYPDLCFYYEEYDKVVGRATMLEAPAGFLDFVSNCGETYPGCQSYIWEWDNGAGKKVNECESYCKETVGVWPPNIFPDGSCFGGDAQYYQCANYPSEDDPPDVGESEMCRVAGEDQTPTCVSEGTCWVRAECDATCHGFYYCNSEITPVCQLGYYKDLEDCEDKNDGGCYETRLGCLSECGCGEDGCGPTLNEPPKIEIGDGGMNPAVNIPGDGRFHICDSDFWLDSVNAPHQAYFKVEINHSESAQKIDVIALGFNHVENGETVYDLWLPVIGLSANSGSGPGGLFVQGEELDKVEVTSITENLSGSPDETTRTMTYLITYDDDFPINLNNIWVSAMDDVGRTLPWTYTDASFKYWDCKVDFEGKLYDDSEVESVSCPVSGWETEASETVNFNSLSFVNVGNTGDTLAATIVGDNSFSGSGLMWGKTYSTNFNEDINCDITSVLARLIDIGSVGTTSCMVNSQINTVRKYDLTIPEYSIDPFVDDPRVQIDFSIAQFADPWYQISGGDLRALGNIGNYVRSPMQMVVDSGGNDAGWIAAGGSFSAGNNDNYSASGWMTENQSGIFGTRFGYDYLYSELKLKKGIGTTAVNWSGIGDTGVYFIDGNLTIDSNNMALAAGGYRVIVVDGDINIDAAVSNLYGVFIADGNINVTGNSATDAQLIIKGMMYSKGNIVMSRGFDTTSLNNTQAATVIDFDPNLIFNMPPAVFKVMSDWRQGPR